MNKVLWKPTPQSIERANLTRYMNWLAQHLKLNFEPMTNFGSGPLIISMISGKAYGLILISFQKGLMKR